MSRNLLVQRSLLVRGALSALVCGATWTTGACTVVSNDTGADAATPGTGGSSATGGGAGQAAAGSANAGSTGAGGGDAQHEGGLSEGGASLLGFVPSNIDLAGLDLSDVGDFDVTEANCTLGSDQLQAVSCGSDDTVLKYKLVTLSNATKVGIYVARTLRIEPNALLTMTGNYPVVFVALDKIEILGGFDASAKQDVAVAGGYGVVATTNVKGAGPGGGGASSMTSAAGGASFCGIGGNGGVESGTPATGGVAYGTADLVPLVAGSSGGAGIGGGSGAGGGAVQLVAANSITVASGGWISVGGGGGIFGGANGQESAGGGSGGAILLEAATVSIAGTLAANGGGGGAGSSEASSGSDATASDHPAPGGGPLSPGGKGSAGVGVKGDDGMTNPDDSAGAGGGGAGRIRINTKSGQALVTGTLSPAATTPCATQGALHG